MTGNERNARVQTALVRVRTAVVQLQEAAEALQGCVGYEDLCRVLFGKADLDGQLADKLHERLNNSM